MSISVRAPGSALSRSGSSRSHRLRWPAGHLHFFGDLRKSKKKPRSRQKGGLTTTRQSWESSPAKQGPGNQPKSAKRAVPQMWVIPPEYSRSVPRLGKRVFLFSRNPAGIEKENPGESERTLQKGNLLFPRGNKRLATSCFLEETGCFPESASSSCYHGASSN